MLLSLRGPLARALALSLLLHAVLLCGVVSVVPPRAELPAGPLSAELRRQRESADAVAAVKAPAQSPPPAPAASPKRERAAVLAAPTPRQAAAPAVVASAAAPEAAAPARPTGVEASTGHAPATTANRAAGEAAAASGGVSADDLRQYRMSLAVNAARFKRYPPLARERGWEGTAEIALELGPLLPQAQVTLASSSGRRVIDDQAIATMREAARVTGLPEGLKGRDLRMRFAVVFSLEDER
jgi:protein TonB